MDSRIYVENGFNQAVLVPILVSLSVTELIKGCLDLLIFFRAVQVGIAGRLGDVD